jgi:hypothetical protein
MSCKELHKELHVACIDFSVMKSALACLEIWSVSKITAPDQKARREVKKVESQPLEKSQKIIILLSKLHYMLKLNCSLDSLCPI